MGEAGLPEVCLGTCAGGHIWGLARACTEKRGPCGRDPTHECLVVVLVVVVVVVVMVEVCVVVWVGAWVMLCVVKVCGVRRAAGAPSWTRAMVAHMARGGGARGQLRPTQGHARPLCHAPLTPRGCDLLRGWTRAVCVR